MVALARKCRHKANGCIAVLYEQAAEFVVLKAGSFGGVTV
jgi:hypothetical protein